MSHKTHKAYSVRQQPYRDTPHAALKHLGFDLLSIVLILITVSSLTLATVHVLLNRDSAAPEDKKTPTSLVPAIYQPKDDAESLSI